MDAMEVTVIAVVVVAIGLVLWWFFGEREATQAKVSGPSGIQEVDVLVKGGYSPDLIVVKKGQPVRLNFRREETSGCSEQVVLSDFGIVSNLPAFETTAVEFTPEKPGEFAFTCGMNMMRGQLVVQQ